MAGLDLELPSGLIALIGERGTGKTSVIELIRYALGARSYTRDSEQESLNHAHSILEGGEVFITLDDDLEEVTIVRSVSDSASRATASFLPPIVFSQKEIETVGTSESGRLALIDAFVRGRADLRAKEAEVANSILSLHHEMETVAAEVERTSEGVNELGELTTKLAELESRTTEVEKTSSVAASKQQKIAELDRQLAKISTSVAVLERFSEQVESWVDTLEERLDDDFGPEDWDLDEQEDPLSELREAYHEITKSVKTAAIKFEKMSATVLSRQTALKERLTAAQSTSRTLRSEVERLVEGAGTLARQISHTKTRISQLQSLQKLSEDRGKRLSSIAARRDALLDELESVRDQRFDLRFKVVDKLNSTLGPRINISLEKYGIFSDYIRTITEALRGSGLKYADLALKIAAAMSPRELVGIVEARDFQRLAKVVSIPTDRAARVIGSLQESGLGEIATCMLEDNVRLRLLDGTEYKDITGLSAGQRCTVILPIVLQHDERILVIDQPEDHIDNAFIAETIIKALKARSKYSQIIVSTHNANIPVLGGAARVVQMTSDGRKGSVELNEPLESPRAVHAISTLMEGGMAAFETRADFYHASSTK